jgi:hypothetical protein
VLKLKLKKSRCTWADDDGTTVKVFVGRRQGITGAYLFSISRQATLGMKEAKQAYVALGFVDQPSFLLVPWAEVEAYLLQHQENGYPGMRVKRPYRLLIQVDGKGVAKQFGTHICPLQSSEPKNVSTTTSRYHT